MKIRLSAVEQAMISNNSLMMCGLWLLFPSYQPGKSEELSLLAAQMHLIAKMLQEISEKLEWL